MVQGCYNLGKGGITMGYERQSHVSPPGRFDAPLLRIGLGSDWHLGSNSIESIRACLEELRARNPDILVLAGDFNGGVYGSKAVRSIMKCVREVFPIIDVLVVLGNHDFWVRGNKVKWGDPDEWKLTHAREFPYRKPKPDAWHRNYEEIIKTFKELRIHFLDEDGPYRHKNYPGFVALGHTLWYADPAPLTNDCLYMPRRIDDTGPSGHDSKSIPIDDFMAKRAHRALENQLSVLTDADKTRIFISHFPVIYPKGMSEMDEAMGGPERYGNMLWQNFGVRYFLNGHCHQHWEHFPRYEAGSEYAHKFPGAGPRGIIVPVYATEDQPSAPDTPSKAE
jgi:3',5'-cyclic AMP phosphodiesterase CpdA